MAFPKEAVRIPVAVSDISIQLYSPDPTGKAGRGNDRRKPHVLGGAALTVAAPVRQAASPRRLQTQ